MRREVWLNYIAVIVAVIVLAFWVWWLFRPKPMPFVLRAKWTVQQGIVLGKPAFLPKGNLLAVPIFSFAQGGTTLSVNFWHVPNGSQAKPSILISKQSQPLGPTPQPITFSPDGRLLAVGYLEQGVGKIGVFRVADGRLVRAISMGMGKSKAFLTPSVLFSPDGKKLAVMHDVRLRFVQVADGKQVETNIMPSMVVFSPDGQLIAALYASDAVNIYNASGRIIRQLRTVLTPSVNLLKFTTATFSHDSQKFLCVLTEGQFQAGRDRRREWLGIWRVSDGKLERTISLTSFYDLSPNFHAPSALSLNASLVALTEPDPSGWDGLLWRIGRLICRLLKRSEPIPPMQVVVRHTADGQVVAKLPRFGRHVTNCVFSPDGHYLVVVHDYRTIALWEWKGR